MSQFQKIFDVLDLFSESRITVSAEEVGELLQLSRPTAFRYLRQLNESGLLSRLSGRYALGPRVIELDYRSRQIDPLLLASRQPLAELTAETQCSAMVSGVYGDQVVNIHQDSHLAQVSNSFGRGRVLPLFRGAASKVILANLPPARMKRLFEDHRDHPDRQRMGADWKSFNHYLRAIRREGFYASRGEVDANVAGVAAPIFNGEKIVVGALTTLFDLPAGGLLDTDRIGVVVMRHAAEISARLGRPLEQLAGPHETGRPASRTV